MGITANHAFGGGFGGGFGGSNSKSKGKSSSTTGASGNGLFGRPTKAVQRLSAIATPTGSLSEVKGITNKGKPTEGGDKRPDAVLKKMNATDQAPLTDVQKAAILDQSFNKQNEAGLNAAQTILGMMPAGPLPMGMAFGVGRWMGEQVDQDALANPDKYKTLPTPGGVISKSGPLNSNRAVAGPAAKTTEASTDETTKKKKQAALPTLLGTPAPNPLGTFSNPMMIT